MDLRDKLLLRPDTRITLADRDPGETMGLDKEAAAEKTEKNIARLDELQYLMYGEHRRALLVVLQGMDGAGKDGTIRHVMRGLNPQGCRVTSFKAPSAEEAEHDFLWRVHRVVPSSGEVAIFNRSHYEDVLVTRVHKTITDKVAKRRFREINQFEEMLHDNGVTILKFFLHISHKEQTARLRARCDDKEKHYKISESDFHERVYWKKYQQAYEDAIDHTSQKHAPWFVIPSDHKWYRNLAISRIIVDALEEMKLEYPQPAFDVSKVCGKL